MIQIYRAEADIADLIQASTSIAYQQEISPLSCDISQKEKIKAGVADFLEDVISAGERDSDLHYVQSILVTTNWNKNDDVFDPVEVWYARHTPQHKPTNVGHDEHEIVGHMTTNWVIDADGKLINDNVNIEELPSLFHVVNGSVIYKAWQDENLVARATKLIEEIDSGKKFVSMECIFTGFDYAILTANGESKVLARTEETAFLTKHLRSYGGTGVYQGHKIGRLLRNITFTGKGFVDKPANPNSIIFDKDKFFNFADAKDIADSLTIESDDINKNGVYISTDISYANEEKDNMTEFYEKENTELKSKVDQLVNQLAEANEKLAKSDVEKLEKTLAKLEAENESHAAKIEELQAEVEVYTKKSEELGAELTEITSVRDELKQELDEVRANELRTNRISVLVDGDIDKEVAEQKVDLFESLSDEQFEVVAKDLIEAAKIINKASDNQDEQEDVSDTEADAKDDDTSDSDDEEVDETEADETVLDNVETDDSEADLSADADVGNDTILELSKALAKMLNIGQDNDNNDEEN